MAAILFTYNDGGRLAAGRKGKVGDCVVRAVAIASAIPYQEVYDAMQFQIKSQRLTKGDKIKSPRNGVDTKRKWFKEYMQSLGFVWIPAMSIGSGCKLHLCAVELPPGRLVCMVSKHACAVIDGILHDTFDCSRDGRRCVYGYWKLANNRPTKEGDYDHE